MIPIKLTLEGLYSYQEKQVIDFTQLIEAGLFGIFGKVGSGKSSILEAISFGLYGESERLNSRDNRAYNMMNLKSDHAVIDFEFYNFADEKYRIRREFKRNSKRFEDVKRGDAVLYQWEGDEWIPLSHLNMDEIVGLSYDNFKRTVIIPQGQFREFIDLKGADRTRMMQQIFGLDRFDLTSRVKRIYGQTKESFDQLKGRLQGFATVTQETIEEQQKILVDEQDKLEKAVNSFKIENESYQQLKAVKEDFESLVVKKEELAALNEQLPDFQQKKKELERFELVEKTFATVLADAENTSIKLTFKEEKNEKLTTSVVQTQDMFSKVSKELEMVQLDFATLEQQKAECYELGLIKGIKEASLKNTENQEHFEKGIKFVNEVNQHFSEAQVNLQQKENELNQTKANRIDSNLIMDIEGWFKDFELLKKSFEEVNQSIGKSTADLQQVQQDIQKLKLKNIDNWQAEISGYRNTFNKKQEQAEQELAHLRVSQQLTQYASDLHNGQACPLCGSLEHPHVLQGNDVSLAIANVERTLSDIKDKQTRLNVYESKAVALFDKYNFFLTQLEELKAKEQANQQAIQLHHSKFTWSIIEVGNKEQFVQLKETANAIQQQVEVCENQYTLLQKEVEKLRHKADQAKTRLAELEVEKAKFESEIQSKSSQIVRLNLQAYLGLEESLITQEEEQRQLRIDNTEKKHSSLTKEFQELSPKLAALQSEQKGLVEEIAELKVSKEKLQKELEVLVHANGLNTLDEVKAILETQLDVKSGREAIQAFEVKLEVVKNNVVALEQKLEKVSFDKEKFEKQQEVIEELELEVKVLTESTAKLKGEVERLTKELAEKKDLLIEHDKVEKRLKNISVLDNMFKGAGFVNYVSGIYLKNLCDMANHRFHRLTNNQLSLQLNESNDFEIVDYLNNGKARSVKTLSGGQSFQVSLSLALALAESVQSLSKSNKNFFFIDEGFGTQDIDSVNIVFETLSNLHKENRIVGIISHVEELQERIPMSLTVVKDEEKGSVIEVN
ncbi:AAA family ATPase [Myroides phaeus]|uniref:AAA family ATPase n=1 Tax=Myroides phaeus TaxID=702745 RepID=UPI002DBCB4EC|nr:AAA family ATPase [Myroides phaeus]MEC4117714.1 AAA family ATPase [Myroides phaeus]